MHPQQEAAVFHSGSSVGLSAGAGCGKTFVLIERFLHELDPAREQDSPGPYGLPAVVAITFTEKATAEMVSRVRREVGRRLRDPARTEQRVWWRTIQRRLDTARISTIHGFCTALLKENAAAADLDPAFRTVEATEEADLRTDAVDAVLKTALARDPAKHDDPEALSPRDLVTRCGLTAVRGVLLNLLDTDRELLEKPWTTADLVAARAGAWARELIDPQFDALRDSADWAALRPVLQRNLTTTPAKAADRRTLLTELELLLTGPPPTPDRLRDRLADLRPLALTGKLGQSKKMWEGDDYGVIQAHLAPFRGAIDGLLKTLGDSPPDFAAALPTVRAYLPLAAAAAKRYERSKRDTARLDFGDQLRLAARLLRDDAVREKVARSIRLLMVDEFQDTSPVQAELVRQIAGLAAGEDAGKLFLVGDSKQSIYRFTGADPEVFGRMRGELAPAGRLPLTKNFRSRPEILRFVNALFDPVMPAYEPLESPPVEGGGVGDLESGGGPHVEFLLPTVPAGPDGKRATAAACREVEAKWVAARIRELLDGRPCVRVKGAADRPPKPGDVCLLFRTLGDVKLYEDALREVGVDAYVAGGKSFFAQQEVQDLVHLLLWLDDPDDTLSLAGVLRSPLCGLSDDTLFTLTDAEAVGERRSAQAVQAVHPPGAVILDALDASGESVSENHRGSVASVRQAPLAAAVLDDTPFSLLEDQAERLAHARVVLRDLLACRSRLGPGGLLERAVQAFGYDGSVMLEFLGERKLANLQKLLRMARNADAAPEGGLRGFAARLLESVKETLTEDEAATVTQDENVVTLMTVHGSKGLEFPVVVACDLDRKPPSVSVSGTFDPELGPIVPLSCQHGEDLIDHGAEIWKAREQVAEEAESVRVFYVAATRAADRLILSAARPLAKDEAPGGAADAPTGVPLKTLDAVFDLTTGKPREDRSAGDPLFFAPQVLVHHDKPAGTGKALPGPKRGTPPEKFADVLRSTEPCEPYDLRRPLPSPRPSAVHVAELAERLASNEERDELARFPIAEPGASVPGEASDDPVNSETVSDPLADARGRLADALQLSRRVEQRRGLDYHIPPLADVLPAVTGRIERLILPAAPNGGRTGQGVQGVHPPGPDALNALGMSAGVAAATAAEVAGVGLPDRLVPRLWAERTALAPLGGGEAALLLVAADGATRLVRTEELPAGACSDDRVAELLRGALL
ncbi:ATP-dependent helicase/nuclease subunit A [Alienimonas californiensis]|uniref:DNA 3'-5' helicase n=2 Tax=Alienimonas californiensis TaxID=2527989 RepID=A0A517PCY7_9PLAN|nr:ATP-dependent helicase/nuclease subunit A [Alienimonas californiensis]